MFTIVPFMKKDIFVLLSSSLCLRGLLTLAVPVKQTAVCVVRSGHLFFGSRLRDPASLCGPFICEPCGVRETFLICSLLRVFIVNWF